MRRWVWVVLVAVAVQATGCCHLCDRCCGSRKTTDDSRLPPPDVPRSSSGGPPPAVLPPPVGTPAANPKTTGAYGGS